jgi:hypothetical protein
MIGQLTLLLGELGIVIIILWSPIEGFVLFVLAHIWAWRQTIWRRQSVISLIQTLREAANK